MKIPLQLMKKYTVKSLPLEGKILFSDLTTRHDHIHQAEFVQLQAEGLWQDGLYLVKGYLRGNLSLICSRCLHHIEYKMDDVFEERFQMLEEGKPGVSDEEHVHEIEGKVLDLQPFIEEQILTTIPYVPRCANAEQCTARMIKRGKDWQVFLEDEHLVDHEQTENHEHHQSLKVDPRLAKLAKYFSNDDHGKQH